MDTTNLDTVRNCVIKRDGELQTGYGRVTAAHYVRRRWTWLGIYRGLSAGQWHGQMYCDRSNDAKSTRARLCGELTYVCPHFCII